MVDKRRHVIEEWDAAADHLATFGDEGDLPRQYLLNPTIFALLGEIAGRRILDAGCGEGYLSRMMARRGATVTGIEPTPSLFNRCVEHERHDPLGVAYLNDDLCATTLADEAFDKVACNMVLMDIPDLPGSIHALARLARPGGDVIVTLLHPCFDQTGAHWPQLRIIETRDYFNEDERPQLHGTRMFHRPLSAYLNEMIAARLTLLQMVEPRLPDGVTFDGNDRDHHVPSFIALHARKAPDNTP